MVFGKIPHPLELIVHPFSISHFPFPISHPSPMTIPEALQNGKVLAAGMERAEARRNGCRFEW
jgi:hypothetical protein